MDEKPSLILRAQASAPFLAERLPLGPQVPEAWEDVWVDAYWYKLALRWGFFRLRKKEILLQNIASYSLPHLNQLHYKLSLTEWETEIYFNEGGRTVCLKLVPTRLSLGEFADFVKFLREKMPDKERKRPE